MRKLVLGLAVSLDGFIEGPKGEYVFSNTLESVQGKRTLVKGDVKKQVQEIKQQEGNDIWLFGGASLTSSLLNLGLVDEIGMAVHPILLGGGKPLFSDIHGRIRLTLADCKTYPTGLVYLTYAVNV